jgi:hypothetical protein
MLVEVLVLLQCCASVYIKSYCCYGCIRILDMRVKMVCHSNFLIKSVLTEQLHYLTLNNDDIDTHNPLYITQHMYEAFPFLLFSELLRLLSMLLSEDANNIINI